MKNLKLNELTALLNYDLGTLAVKIYKPNEKGEVSREDTAEEYGLLWTQPYLSTFTYRHIAGNKNDFRKITNASVLELQPTELIFDFEFDKTNKEDFETFNDARFMICLKLPND